MNVYILTIMLLDPTGKAAAPVVHEHKDRLACESARVALYSATKAQLKGWTLRSAECAPVGGVK